LIAVEGFPNGIQQILVAEWPSTPW
jgi:hypothetical protein